MSGGAGGDRVTERCGELAILHEDDWLIAIDKPAGLLSQPGRHVEDSVSVRVREARPEAIGSLLVHRLDMDTSGVLLLAKTPAAHAAMQQQFEKRQVQKRYRAVLERAPSGAAGRILLPLRLDPDDRPHQIVCHERGRTADTVWRRLDGGNRFAGCHVSLLPRTGRSHQLRVHAADPGGLGNPVRGDRLYGREDERMYLHAERLTVAHPHDGERLTIVSPCPFDDGVASTRAAS